jgi:hypothetical protein
MFYEIDAYQIVRLIQFHYSVLFDLAAAKWISLTSPGVRPMSFRSVFLAVVVAFALILSAFLINRRVSCAAPVLRGP